MFSFPRKHAFGFIQYGERLKSENGKEEDRSSTNIRTPLLNESQNSRIDSKKKEFPNLEGKISNRQSFLKKHVFRILGKQTYNNVENEIPEDDYYEYSSINFLSLFKFSSCSDVLLMCFGCIAAFLGGVTIPTGSILIGDVFDQFIQHHAEILKSGGNETGNTTGPDDKLLADISEPLLLLFILTIWLFFCNYIMISFFSIAAANQAMRIKCAFLKSILRQNIGWFDQNQTGDFATHITTNLKRIQDGISENVSISINLISQSVSSILISFYLGWKLTLVTVSIMPFLAITIGIVTKYQAKTAACEKCSYDNAGAIAEEALSSIKTVAAFGGERKEIERYDNCVTATERHGIKRGFLTSINGGIMWFGVFTSCALTFWFGVRLIAHGRIYSNQEYTPKILIVVFFNVMTAVLSISQLTPYIEAFNMAMKAATKIYQIIDRIPLIDSASQEGEIPQNIEGDITLNSIQFFYPSRPDVMVLNDFSLNVKSGETVAVVGPSGCGKSTVIQLIQRYYDVQHGCITIDGHNVQQLNVGWLRGNIGVVGQEPVLFSTTIAENIRYGNPNATQFEIEKAARAANIHDFISILPEGYNTVLGENGAQLSGGQKQRIAIARALVKNPKILLLDEPTSSLDTESEYIVRVTLDQVRKNRTTIMVTHRLSTVRKADKIAAMANGKVQEFGSHDELMNQKGIYYKLVQIQDGCDEFGNKFPNGQNFETSSSMESTLEATYRPPDNIFGCITSPSDDKEMISDSKEKKMGNRLSSLFLPEWPYILIGGLSAFVTGVCPSIYGIVFGDIAQLLSEHEEKILLGISHYSLIFVWIALASGVSAFLQTFMFSIVAEKMTSKLRKMSFTAIIYQDISWFDVPRNSVGVLCSRLSCDTTDVQGAGGARISTMLQGFSTLIAATFIGFYYHFSLGLIVLPSIPLVYIATYLENNVIRDRKLMNESAIDNASRIAVEAVENIRTVASLHQEETFYSQFRNALELPLKQSRKSSHVRGIVYGFAQFFPEILYVIALCYGTLLIIKDDIAYGNVIKVIESVFVGSLMVSQTVSFSPDYQKAKLAAIRIFNLLDQKPRIDVCKNEGTVLEDWSGKVNFEKIHFQYPNRPDVDILRNFNLDIEPGKTIAVVGNSGAGKSTCVQLIERFYETSAGKLAIGGMNIKSLQVSSLRSQVGLVSQEPILFSFSLAENIAYGDSSREVPMAEIIAAARDADIHDFISNLPQGYSTNAGDKGTQISGGQKQRIAIARALIRNPKLLLLDEATSALDAESEKVVQNALNKASSGRTTLVITHQLKAVQNVDSIAMIQNGRIVEKGTHQELYASGGHYYHLYNIQNGNGK